MRTYCYAHFIFISDFYTTIIVHEKFTVWAQVKTLNHVSFTINQYDNILFSCFQNSLNLF